MKKTYQKITIMIEAVAIMALFSIISHAADKQTFNAGFDCNKATSKIEKTICSDEELASADAHLNSSYKTLMSRLSQSDAVQVKNDQIAWLKSRDKTCGSSKYIVDCLNDAYEQRQSILDFWNLTTRGNHFKEEYVLDKDPSTIPLKKIPEEPQRSRERYRYVADFNNDGIDDVALSYDTSMFGNAFGHFFLYLGNGNGRYKEIGSFAAYPQDLELKKMKSGGSIFSTFTKLSSDGCLSKIYKVTNDGLFSLGKKEFRCSQAGVFDPTIDQSLQKSNIESRELVRPEESETKDDTVTWTKLPR